MFSLCIPLVFHTFVLLLQSLTVEERFALIRSIGEECIQDDELLSLLKFKESPICYDGFEPSGRMHIAQVMTWFFPVLCIGEGGMIHQKLDTSNVFVMLHFCLLISAIGVPAGCYESLECQQTHARRL